MKAWSVLGNTQKLDGGAMFGNAPKAVWQRWYPADDHSRIHLACRSLLLAIEDKKVLLETGIGSFFSPKLKERFGVVEKSHMLLENLAKLSIKHEDIDYVILSHLHFDHAGGLLTEYKEGAESSLLFPNAKYVVGETAFERACKPHPRDRASFIPELQPLLQQSGRLVLVPKDHTIHPEVFPEAISFLYSDGHTPGQMHVMVKGDKENLFFAGDLIPGKAWVHLPITMGYDRFPEKVIDEKSDLYEKTVGHDTQIFFTHDIGCAAAKIQKNEKSKFITYDEKVELLAFDL